MSRWGFTRRARGHSRGQATVEYVAVTVALVVALGLLFGQHGVLDVFIDAMRTAWARFAYALSLAF